MRERHRREQRLRRMTSGAVAVSIGLFGIYAAVAHDGDAGRAAQPAAAPAGGTVGALQPPATLPQVGTGPAAAVSGAS